MMLEGFLFLFFHASGQRGESGEREAVLWELDLPSEHAVISGRFGCPASPLHPTWSSLLVSCLWQAEEPSLQNVLGQQLFQVNCCKTKQITFNLLVQTDKCAASGASNPENFTCSCMTDETMLVSRQPTQEDLDYSPDDSPAACQLRRRLLKEAHIDLTSFETDDVPQRWRNKDLKYSVTQHL